MTDPDKALLLGVDGGGSKTRAVVATMDLTVVGQGEAEGCNLHTAGYDGAVASLTAAIAAARNGALGAGHDGPIAMGCLGLAGVDREADRAKMQAWADGAALASRVKVLHDPELILAAGTPDGNGVALICGTGSVSIAHDPAGRQVRAGGWGYLIGDEGGGFALAAAALRLATQTADGRARAGRLLEALLAKIGDPHPESMIPFAYGRGASPKRIAQLSEVVLDLADRGDATSQELVAKAAADAARLVDVLIERLEYDTPPLAFGGSLLARSPFYVNAVTSRIGRPFGGVTVVPDPAVGAIQIAKRLYAR